MNLLYSKIFDDVEHLASDSLKWDLEFLQLSAGRFHGEYQMISVHNMLIHYAKFNQAIRQRGMAPKGYRTFAILASDDIPLFWRGQRITGKDLMLFPQDGELDSVSGESFEVFTVSVPDAELRLTLEQQRSASLLPQLEQSGVYAGSPNSLVSVRKTLNLIRPASLQTGSPSERFKNSVFLKNQILEALLSLVKNPATQSSMPNLGVRNRAVRLAEEYITEHGSQPISAAQLSTACGVSSRTLQYAFKERFGISPLHYAKAHRLRLVRIALLAADPARLKVSDVAFEHGFWHLGQFSTDYKRQFGELPSHTLGS
jgi:AraC family ethanolamine operon transcriptional activator